MHWRISIFLLILPAILGLVNGGLYNDLTRRKNGRFRRSVELDDLLAVESQIVEDLSADAATYVGHNREQSLNHGQALRKKQSKLEFGSRTSPRNKNVEREVKILPDTDKVLDFRINNKHDHKRQRNGTPNEDKKNTTKDYTLNSTTSDMMRMEEAGNGKIKKEVEVPKKGDDEEKTLAQQVADGKYGLIQNEIFPNGSKRPGIISYLPNDEVPSDTKDNLGGLDKDEIWLAEDHVLVLRGGRLPDHDVNHSDPVSWPPIDDYEAPLRQVKIPKKPKVPPPFPIQLSENGPLEFVKGINGSGGPPSFPFFSPNGLPPPVAGQPFPGQGSPYDPSNGTFPYIPPPDFINPAYINSTLLRNGPLPPFLANLPPGAAFLPPPGNLTEYDEDDPSIYYPPPYDFFYPRDNSSVVPPGPLVPGIVLPPPPNFFAPLMNESNSEEKDEDNETEDQEITTKKPFQGPAYLPVPRNPTVKYRPYKRPTKRPYTTLSPKYNEISDTGKDSPTLDSLTTPAPKIQYVYPEPQRRKPYEPKKAAENTGLSSPIYVPDAEQTPIYHPIPTTSPKPNHITLPKSEHLKKTLPKEIYVITTPLTPEKPKEERKNKIRKENYFENISPDIHPLRSLIKPNVTVSYKGKYGHLPAPANPTAGRTEVRVQENKPQRGHYITKSPQPVFVKTEEENEVKAAFPTDVSVTPVPVLKIRTRPSTTAAPHKQAPTSEESPTKSTKATFYFYEEPTLIENGKINEVSGPGILHTTDPKIKDFVTPKQSIPSTTKAPKIKVYTLPDENKGGRGIQYYSTAAVTPSTPVRQFLEETFHASNVLPNKPQPSHFGISNNYESGIYREAVPKTKLNYSPITVTKTPIKYHYVTETPKNNYKPHLGLEIENAGSSGLQDVNLIPEKQKQVQIATPTYVTTPRPYKIVTPSGVDTTAGALQINKRPPVGGSLRVTSPRPNYSYSTTTPKPDDGPFIPSNYYATANPQDFTPVDPSLVDDITKNYFTIFGQKLTSTTPVVPTGSIRNIGSVSTQQPVINTNDDIDYNHENIYIPPPEKQNIIQRPDTVREPQAYLLTRRPQYYKRPNKALKPVSIDTFTTKKPVQYIQNVTPTRTNFEQYLKEITGEDQREYVEVVPTKLKKGKSNLGYSKPFTQNLNYNPISMYLNPPNPPIRNQHSQYLLEVTSPKPVYSPSYENVGGKLKYVPDPYKQYIPPHFSTTMRPSTTVDIEPQYIRHVSSTIRPLDGSSLRPLGSTPDPGFGHYLQTLSSYSSPTTLRPTRIKNPTNLQYISNVQIAPNAQQVEQKPISLESDILVNYKQPLPTQEPEAEILSSQKPFEHNSNFKVVTAPDLSRPNAHRGFTRSTRPNQKVPEFFAGEMNPKGARQFLENLPNSGYFNPVDGSFGNAFVSYNLPGNGGHFYFLTPQAVSERTGDSERSVSENKESSQGETFQGQGFPQHEYSNQDYLRRRRKKS